MLVWTGKKQLVVYELIYQLDAIEYTQLHQVGKLIHNSNQNARYNYPKFVIHVFSQ